MAIRDEILKSLATDAAHLPNGVMVDVAEIVARIDDFKGIRSATLFGSSSIHDGKDVDIFLESGKKREVTESNALAAGREFTVPPEKGTKWIDITERPWSFEESIAAGECEVRSGHRSILLYSAKR